MNPPHRSLSQEEKDLVQQYLDQGGTVQQINPGERSEEIEYTGGFYQRRKKKADAEKNKDDDHG